MNALRYLIAPQPAEMGCRAVVETFRTSLDIKVVVES